MKSSLVALAFIALISCKDADDRIATEVNAKLMAANPYIRATVEDAVVTLTGTCPDPSCKNVSETAAREVSGVKRVINEIQVAPSQQ